MTGDAKEALARGEPALFINEVRDVGVVGVPIELITSKIMNYLVTACRGIVYVALPEERLRELGVQRQPHAGSGPEHFFVPVDALARVTTGISAADRTETVRQLVHPDARSEDFRQPGHITPMALHPDGVLGRMGLAESIQDAAAAAGFAADGVVFCGVLTDDGHMANSEQLRSFAQEQGLAIDTVADAVRRRRRQEGWDRKPNHILDLSYVEWQAQVATSGGGQQHDRVPIRVVPVCVAGHLLGTCEADEHHDERGWVDADSPRAVVATWPRTGVPSCGRALPRRVERGIAALIAADHFAAEAAFVPVSDDATEPSHDDLESRSAHADTP